MSERTPFDAEVAKRYLNQIAVNASKLFPNWEALPASDPLRIIAESVALVSASLDHKIQNLPRTIAKQLPGIFGIESTPANAARGWVEIRLAAGKSKELLLPEHLEFVAEGPEKKILFRTTETAVLCDVGEVVIFQEGPNLYVGLERVPEATNLNLYFTLERSLGAESMNPERKVNWSALKKGAWVSLSVVDQTHQLSRSGLVKFFSSQILTEESSYRDLKRYWIRGELSVSEESVPLRSVHANVVPVINLRHFEQICIGSGNGLPAQRLSLPEGEITKSFKVKIYNGETGRYEYWEEVQTFLLSESTSRHWVLDAKTRQILFGDGKHGRAAPPGYDNVWIEDFAACDGVAGNLAKETPILLKNEDWRLGSVKFFTDTMGGMNRVIDSDLIERMYSSFKNKDRAVTLSDFREMAMNASTRVGKVYVRADRPFVSRVTVLLKPEFSRSPQTLDFTPTETDREQVSEALDAKRTLNSEIQVIAPKYRDVTVKGQIFVKRLTQEVREAVEAHLRDYFSPYSKREQSVTPGSKLSREALTQHTERLHWIISIRNLVLEDTHTGVSSPAIELGAEELPRLHLRISIEEAAL